MIPHIHNKFVRVKFYFCLQKSELYIFGNLLFTFWIATHLTHFYFQIKTGSLIPSQRQALHFPSLLLCQAQNAVSFEVFPSLVLSLVTYKVAVEQYVFVGVRATPFSLFIPIEYWEFIDHFKFQAVAKSPML